MAISARGVAAGILLAACLALAEPQLAVASQADGAALSMNCDDAVQLAAVDVMEVPAECDPASVMVGVRCGMEDMCGQDPCLCGAVDDWGTCACNGLQEARPTFALSGDVPAGVGTVELLGRTYLVSVGLGGASGSAVLTAELAHHAPASADMRVEVAPFGPVDALKVLAALAVAAAVCAVVALAVRAVVRLVRRIVARRRAHAGSGGGGPAGPGSDEKGGARA